jgi:hypothetical protein
MTAPYSVILSLLVRLARRLEDAYAVCVTAETALAARNQTTLPLSFRSSKRSSARRVNS